MEQGIRNLMTTYFHLEGTLYKEVDGQIPDRLPVLEAGSHPEGSGKGCAMEIASWLAAEQHSDRPQCVHPGIAEMARVVNDSLPDEDRQKMWPLIIRCLGTASDDKVLSVNLAIWCAQQVLSIFEDQYPDDDRPRKAIEAAQEWAKCPCEENAYAYAAAAAAAAANAAAANRPGCTTFPECANTSGCACREDADAALAAARAPLILVENGYKTWRVLGPIGNFGKNLGLSGVPDEDRRLGRRPQGASSHQWSQSGVRPHRMRSRREPNDPLHPR
jgi:hypothetical protein